MKREPYRQTNVQWQGSTILRGMQCQFTTDWFSHKIPVLQQHVGELSGTPDMQGIEIGCFEGRSTCWFLQHIFTHQTSTLTCIDPFMIGDEFAELILRRKHPIPLDDDYEKRFDKNIHFIGASNNIRKMRGPSSIMLRTLPCNRYRFIYIDGSHTASAVLQDMVLAWELLEQGGVMILDDYLWTCFENEPLRHPKAGIDAFLSIFAGQYQLLHKEYQVILRRTAQHAKSVSPSTS